MQKELGLFPTEKVMTVKEVASALGVSKDTILNCIKRILPNKLEHGKTTFLNEQEVACISKELKNNTSVQQQIDNNGKFMTIRNVADVLNVSYSSVYRAVCKLFPDKTKNGKLSILNEIEVSRISKELKSDYHTAQLTFSAGEKVRKTTTDLEILENYKKANEEFVALLSRKYEEEKTKRIAAESVVNRIANSNGLKTIQETADILGYGSSTYFDLLRGKGIIFKDKKTQTNLPKREYLDSGYFEVKEEPYERNGKTFLYTRIFVTAKGLLWLEKKTPRRAF